MADKLLTPEEFKEVKMAGKNTFENRVTLARNVVDGMDMDSLIEWAVDMLIDMYELNCDHFEEDWENWMELTDG